jgi:predicted Ser/Thr protein kinase
MTTDKLELVEPTFVLRASDPLAPSLIRQWARRQELEIAKGRALSADLGDVERARKLAADMEKWIRNDIVQRHATAREKFSVRYGKRAEVIKLSTFRK